MKNSIILPPLPEHPDRHTLWSTAMIDMLHARDVEVAKAVLKAVAAIAKKDAVGCAWEQEKGALQYIAAKIEKLRIKKAPNAAS